MRLDCRNDFLGEQTWAVPNRLGIEARSNDHETLDTESVEFKKTFDAVIRRSDHREPFDEVMG